MSTVAECIEENDKWLQRENNSLNWYRNNLVESLSENDPWSIYTDALGFDVMYGDGTSKIQLGDLSGWQPILETALVVIA
ncbi:MAG: hypothetical protein JNM43_08960, partial [Planctomycetaceae bacterium]|nr:hypothetical protein [Planctomycetaceae bacterium]